MSSTIAVEELRVGMYIHLEGGWLSHPFPLSAFRIGSPEQIGTLRGMGLKQVRWLPEKSDPPGTEAAGAATAAATAAAAATAVTSASASSDRRGRVIGSARFPSSRSTAAAAGSAASRDGAAAKRREWLAEQREASLRCEQQYGEAADAWRSATASALTHPQEAGRTTASLASAMLGKMLGAPDTGVRLVSGGNDHAAAHALNVTVISMLIGRALNLNDAELHDLGVGALLHDVGKLEVPERLRYVEDGFSAAELGAYRDHVAKGVLQGHRMGLNAGVLAVLAQHHEHADGSGFPMQLQGERMSMAAHIVAIVNRYDNMCNPAASRAFALTPHEAVATLFAQHRARFDNTVLQAFIRMMGVYPAGSLVQLTDDRYAMVVGVNSGRPLKPRVLVHDTTADGDGGLLLDLDRATDLGIRRSLPASKVPAAALRVLDPRPRVAYYFEPTSRTARGMESAA